MDLDADIVRQIVVVDAQGQSRVVYERPGRKRKKGTPGLRDMEKALRRRIEASQAGVEAYLERHERSNEKRRDGWLRDLAVNFVRANQKGAKVLSRS